MSPKVGENSPVKVYPTPYYMTTPGLSVTELWLHQTGGRMVPSTEDKRLLPISKRGHHEGIGSVSRRC